jgi:hypothetical protein
MRGEKRAAAFGPPPLILVVSLSIAAVAGGHSGGTVARTSSGDAGGLRYVVESKAVAVGSRNTGNGLCHPRRPSGGGVVSEAGYGGAFISSSFPMGSSPPDSGWYSSVENQGATPFALVTTAICAPAALALEYELKTVHQDPGTSVSIGVDCAPGRVVTGGGIRTNGNFDEMLIAESYPVDGADADHRSDDGWQGTVVNPPTAQPKQFRVVAICASARRAHLKYTKATVPAAAGSQTVAEAGCAVNRHVTSGGARSSPVGVLSSTSPIDATDTDDVPDDGWQARVDMASGGSVTVFAICRR